MTAATVAGRPTSALRRRLFATAAAAGVVVVGEHLHHAALSMANHAPGGDMPGMVSSPTAVVGMHHAAGSPVSAWASWTLMVIAMMLPLAAAGAERIAADGLWRRRIPAVVEYLLGYLAVWSLFGVLVTSLVVNLWPAGPPAAVPVGVLLVAAGWQMTPIRKRALRRCGQTTPIRVRGWQADADCMTAGVSAARPCLITCGPVMSVMTVAHSAVLMTAVTALMLNERRRGPNPSRRPGRPFEAVCLTLLAVVVGIVTIVLRHQMP